MDWTRMMWNALCVLTLVAALAVVTRVLWILPPLLAFAFLVPPALVMLIFAVAAWAALSGPGR